MANMRHRNVVMTTIWGTFTQYALFIFLNFVTTLILNKTEECCFALKIVPDGSANMSVSALTVRLIEGLTEAPAITSVMALRLRETGRENLNLNAT